LDGEFVNVLLKKVVENKKIKMVLLLNKVNQYVTSQYAKDTSFTIKRGKRTINNTPNLIQRLKVALGLDINDNKNLVLAKP
jgi:hypothetical protein